MDESGKKQVLPGLQDNIESIGLSHHLTLFT
ncbi:hypothetical protein FHS68_002143 [Dyadobacter arcticus]|uniref:Uncharacterized protein n=1 Tax=Dyadobacter arcticus TaxID=1078754 RepID=A0ABX0UIX8_9BACT|nr:hypothetical protein [Dyadobacter arcticus]